MASSTNRQHVRRNESHSSNESDNNNPTGFQDGVQTCTIPEPDRYAIGRRHPFGACDASADGAILSKAVAMQYGAFVPAARRWLKVSGPRSGLEGRAGDKNRPEQLDLDLPAPWAGYRIEDDEDGSLAT